jgi:hypothetical protein
LTIITVVYMSVTNISKDPYMYRPPMPHRSKTARYSPMGF